MDPSLLKGPSVMDKVKVAWPNIDPLVKWDLCLQKVKKILQDEKWRRALDRKNRGILVDRLSLLKQVVCANPTPELSASLILLEVEIKQQELADATTWHRRSRVRWLALGEAPSRYFFA